MSITDGQGASTPAYCFFPSVAQHLHVCLLSKVPQYAAYITRVAHSLTQTTLYCSSANEWGFRKYALRHGRCVLWMILISQWDRHSPIHTSCKSLSLSFHCAFVISSLTVAPSILQEQLLDNSRKSILSILLSHSTVLIICQYKTMQALFLSRTPSVRLLYHRYPCPPLLPTLASLVILMGSIVILVRPFITNSFRSLYQYFPFVC
jgi:hypothetical protein